MEDSDGTEKITAQVFANFFHFSFFSIPPRCERSGAPMSPNVVSSWPQCCSWLVKRLPTKKQCLHCRNGGGTRSEAFLVFFSQRRPEILFTGTVHFPNHPLPHHCYDNPSYAQPPAPRRSQAAPGSTPRRICCSAEASSARVPTDEAGRIRILIARPIGNPDAEANLRRCARRVLSWCQA